MQFIKNFFKHDSVVGLSGLRKKSAYTCIQMPRNFKSTPIQNVKDNYLLL